jgi:hypothetical protein
MSGLLEPLSTSPLLIAAVVFGALGALLVLAGVAALWRARPLRFALRTLAGLLMLGIGALAAALSVGTHGYRALTHEALAARIVVAPAGAQRFDATLQLPDGRALRYELAGDEIYVDAHILKWKPIANVVGLHTAYELDRLAGRYRDIEQERNAAKTVYSVAPVRMVDLFNLRQRHAFLGALVDAEYGSATFVPVSRPSVFELRVSPSGLLLREAPPQR